MNQQDKNRLLDAYQKGTIGSEDKRLLELVALEDTFLFEALEGSYESNISVDQLRERLHSKVKKERRRVMWLPAVAATLLIVSAVMWWNNSDEGTFAKETQFVLNDEPSDEKNEGLASDDSFSDDEGNKIPPPVVKTSQNATIDGVPIKVKTKDIEAKRQETTKNQIDAYLEQKPTVSSSKVKTNKPPAEMEEEIIEDDFEEVPVGDLNTEYSPERVEVENAGVPMEEPAKEIKQTREPQITAMSEASPRKKEKSRVTLDADSAAEEYPVLDEVIVTNSQTSIPLIGYKDLEKFIKKNKLIGLQNQDVKGRVRLQFTVNDQGDLSNFKVLQSLGEEVDNHSIELLKKSGKWSAGQASYTIKY